MKNLFLSLLFLPFLTANAQTPTQPGRNYAVFFYVTTFQSGWAALPETKSEAQDLKKELETNFNFTCELVANPTKQQMRQKIRSYNDRLTASDQVLYFFSMHGSYVSGRDRGYLIGADGEINDTYGDHWLSYDDLRSDLDNCNAKHILLALDACHSGSFGIRNRSRPASPTLNESEDCALKVSKTMRYTGRQYCTSGNKDAKTPAKSHFAKRFLEALRSGGERGVVRFYDLEYYLGQEESPQPESGTFGNHDPGGDFVFVRNNACSMTNIHNTNTVGNVPPVRSETSDVEERVWNNAKTRRDGQLYLDIYPNGKYAAQAAQINTSEKAANDKKANPKSKSDIDQDKKISKSSLPDNKGDDIKGKEGNSKSKSDRNQKKYESENITLEGTKWYLQETQGMAIAMDLTFEAGGTATWQQSNGPNSGTFKWSGTSSNIIIEGPFGPGSTIKMTGDLNTGLLYYSIPGSITQTGQYKFTLK